MFTSFSKQLYSNLGGLKGMVTIGKGQLYTSFIDAYPYLKNGVYIVNSGDEVTDTSMPGEARYTYGLMSKRQSGNDRGIGWIFILGRDGNVYIRVKNSSDNTWFPWTYLKPN